VRGAVSNDRPYRNIGFLNEVGNRFNFCAVFEMLDVPA
jgi:hypothetical protein